VRLFIAIDLSHAIREQLSDQINGLTQLLGSKSIRWVKASSIHLTLKFLGETTENQVENINRVLKNITPQFSPFEIHVGGFGCFPKPSRPRVFWIGVQEHNGILKQLHGMIEGELEKLGFRKEGRPFAGHLTLGRLRKHISPSELRTLTADLEAVQVGELGTEFVKEIVLFRSVLQPTGAVYTRLGTFRLNETD
jgi:2'-5' RNA ligase